MSSSSSLNTTPFLSNRRLITFTYRRTLREPSMHVRETEATVQLELRPLVILDLIWNLGFIFVSILVLIMTRDEHPKAPLRVWVVGYALQCLVHMVCLCVKCEHRNRRRFLNLSLSVVKKLESTSKTFSFCWWIIGIVWASHSDHHNAPLLYWLCLKFLGYDMFRVVLFIVGAFVVGIAGCCCGIIAILLAFADKGATTKDDIELLPKYKFKRTNGFKKVNGEIQKGYGGIMVECDTDAPIKHALSEEDAKCCICLCTYNDETELRELPCCHHFHATCVEKWLFVNPTCPLCKFNLLRYSNQSGIDQV